MSHPAPGAPRATALRASLTVPGLHSLAFLYAEYTPPGGSAEGRRPTFTSFAFLPLHVGSALALWYAALRPDLPRDTRKGLRWLSGAFGVLVIGSTVWFTMARIGRPLAYISWADL